MQFKLKKKKKGLFSIKDRTIIADLPKFCMEKLLIINDKIIFYET